MFEYGGIGIRAVEEADLEWMREVRNRVQMSLSHIALIGPEEQRRWFQSLPDRERQYYVICDGRFRVGYVRFDEIDRVNRTMRIGGDIAPEHQRSGYGTRMMQLMFKYGFDYLDMHRLWLLVLQTNEVAIHLYRRAGMQLEGRQREAIYREGQRVDYLMFSILKSEYHRD